MNVFLYSRALERFVLSTTHGWLSVLVWAAGFLFMIWMQSMLQVGLAALMVALILTSAVASLFVRPTVAIIAGIGGSVLFSFLFVQPIGRPRIALREYHELLLMAAMVVSLLVGILASRLRLVMEQLQHRMAHLRLINQVSSALNQSVQPLLDAGSIHSALEEISQARVCLAVDERFQVADSDALAHPSGLLLWGDTTGEPNAALRRCIDTQAPVHIGDAAVVLPMLAGKKTPGAAMLRWADAAAVERSDLDAVQALCSYVGIALERAQEAREAEQARATAYRQQLSNLVLSAISHEYRTPLASILSFASSLHENHGTLPKNQKIELIRGIEGEAEHLRRVTGNMLQLAQLDMADERLELEWETVEDVVGSVLHRFKLRYPEWQVRAELAPDLPLVRCDAILLAQVIDNLIDNARRYAGPQPPTVSAWADQQRVWIAVDDQGPGIDERFENRIFDAFDRAGRRRFKTEHDASAERPGAGVGLALSRTIMRAHGGDLRYLRRSEGGSRFLGYLERSAQQPSDALFTPA